MALGQGMKYLVDYGLVAGQPAKLDRGVLVLFAMAVVLALASYSRFYLVTSIGERVVADLRKRVFAHILTLSPEYFEVTRTGEVLARLTADTTLLQAVVGARLPFAMRNLMLVLGGLVLLFVTSVKLAGIILAGRAGGRVADHFPRPAGARLSHAAQGRIGDVNAEANETIHAIRTVQAYNHEQLDAQLFAGQIEDAFAAALAWIRARARLTAMVMVLVFGAVCFGVWIGGYDVLNNKISAGQLLTFIFYAVVVASAVGGLGESWGDLQRAAGAMERLSDLLATTPSIAPAGFALAAAAARKRRRQLRECGLQLSAAARSPCRRWADLQVAARRESWRWSAHRARARPRSFSCCCASTIPRAGASASTASISRRRSQRRCASASAWCRRSR